MFRKKEAPIIKAQFWTREEKKKKPSACDDTSNGDHDRQRPGRTNPLREKKGNGTVRKKGGVSPRLWECWALEVKKKGQSARGGKKKRMNGLHKGQVWEVCLHPILPGRKEPVELRKGTNTLEEKLAKAAR